MIETGTDLLANDLEVTPTIMENLNSTAKWGKFLSIVGIISCALLILAGIIAGAALLNRSSYQYMPFNPLIIVGIYVTMGIVFFFPCLYLLRFSNKVQQSIKQASQESFETAFQSLRSMYSYIGVVTIIIIIMYIGIIVWVSMRSTGY